MLNAPNSWRETTIHWITRRNNDPYNPLRSGDTLKPLRVGVALAHAAQTAAERSL